MKRGTYIGGSMAADLLGHGYRTIERAVWALVREEEGTLPMVGDIARGVTMEPVIAAFLAERGEHEYPCSFVRHPELPFVGGTPDMYLGDAVVEIKAPRPTTLARILRDGLPKPWIYQLQHYLMITGRPRGLLAVWSFDHWEPYEWEFEADAALHRLMERQYTAVWDAVQRLRRGESAPLPDPVPIEGDVDEIDRLAAAHLTASEEVLRADRVKKEAAAKLRALLSVGSYETQHHRITVGARRLVIKPR